MEILRLAKNIYTTYRSFSKNEKRLLSIETGSFGRISKKLHLSHDRISITESD